MSVENRSASDSTAWIDPMRYAVVIEKGQRNFSAYVPDLTGCVSNGDTLAEVKAEIREAIALHLEGMRGWDGDPAALKHDGLCGSGGAGGVSGLAECG